MATVESMRQLLVQHYGPLPSPLQSGLSWRRSLPPSRSLSRVGSPLVQGPLTLVPDSHVPSEPIPQELAASAAVPTMLPPPAEDIEMESVVEAQQVSDMLGSSVGATNLPSVSHPSPPSLEVEVDQPEPCLSDSRFGPRQRTTSGNRKSIDPGWGWALSTGEGSSHAGNPRNDTKAEDKKVEQGAEAKDKTVAETE